jgi:hypothetical protein
VAAHSTDEGGSMLPPMRPIVDVGYGLRTDIGAAR